MNNIKLRKEKISRTIKLKYLKGNSKMGFQKGFIPWNTGKKLGNLSLETKKKISKALKGRKLTKEWKRKIGNANKGKIYSKDYKKKMSKRCKGINTWMKGQKPSLKLIEKRRKGVLKYYKNSENRKKLSLIMKEKSLKGKENPNWKGGITPINHKIRHSIEFRLWREAVFARDNWTCKKCNLRGFYLHPHHIKNFSKYFKLRFIVSNGITFCKKCHKLFHKKYGRKNNTKRQLKEFLNKSK